VKAKVTPEHKVRCSSYRVRAVVDEGESLVTSVECEDCAASAGKYSSYFTINIMILNNKRSFERIFHSFFKTKMEGFKMEKYTICF
jgi:hypothetical protein